MQGSHWSGWRSRERGFLTLIALLVVIVIIAILFATQFGGRPSATPGAPAQSGGRGGPQTLLGAAVERADSAVCRNNLSQLRAAIGVYQANTGSNPLSLADLQANLRLNCPVGGEPYQYDPTSGAVHCTHPGHQSY